MNRTEPDIIEPEDAAKILKPVLEQYQSEGWVVILENDYAARITRGTKNIDLRVDLLGELSIEEKPLSEAQKVGQLVAIMLLIAGFLVLLTLVSALGLLG